MRHGLRYEGSYAKNFTQMQPNATEYIGEDGSQQPIAKWPETVTGLRYGFMEQPGKRFFVVRVGYGDDEILLHHPIRIDPSRHLGGKRFSPEPMTVDDNSAGQLLGDILDANREQQADLNKLREHVRQVLRETKAKP
jgi:hypothetical protein